MSSLVQTTEIKANSIIMHKRWPHIVNYVQRLPGSAVLTVTDVEGNVEEITIKRGDNVKLLDTWSYSDWCAFVQL
jgi:hypothetical protein